jgi:hypothetical protein
LHKLREVSPLAENLLASQEGLCCIQLFGYGYADLFRIFGSCEQNNELPDFTEGVGGFID